MMKQFSWLTFSGKFLHCFKCACYSALQLSMLFFETTRQLSMLVSEISLQLSVRVSFWYLQIDVSNSLLQLKMFPLFRLHPVHKMAWLMKLDSLLVIEQSAWQDSSWNWLQTSSKHEQYLLIFYLVWFYLCHSSAQFPHLLPILYSDRLYNHLANKQIS